MSRKMPDVRKTMSDQYGTMMKASLIAYLRSLEQPRALLLSGSPSVRSTELLEKLAQDADYILAVDSGASMLEQLGVMPDLMLGDFDSIQPSTFARFKAEGIEFMTFDPHKDMTDLELAIDELLNRNYYSIVATNVLGGRVDHELGSLACLAAAAQKGARVIVIEESEACLFLSAPAHLSAPACLNTQAHLSAWEGSNSFTLDITATVAPSYISLLPWGGKATVSIKGVRWELDQAVLSPYNTLGVSNEPCGERVEVKVFDGTVIVILQY